MRPQKAAATGQLKFMDRGYPIQVKQKDKAGRPDIDAFGPVPVFEMGDWLRVLTWPGEQV